MKVVFELEAELQLYDLADMVDDLNIRGAGERWINRFLDFVEDYAKPNVTYALCHNLQLAAKRYSCITFRDKWVIAFKITKEEMRIYEIMYGGLLK
jgi:hypothetical protein